MKAFVFPGQGSQSAGMLAEQAEKHSVFQEYFARASECLGFDMEELVATGGNGKINATEYTQPAILTVSCALWQVWLNNNGALPNLLAGHSLGEYSALVAAKSLTFEDAVTLVHLRGRLMQDASEDGIMLAIIGLDDYQVKSVCASVCDQLGEYAIEPANYNAPGQVVVAGKSTSLDAVTEQAKAAGAKRVLPLAVSTPSHCNLMRGASDKLAQALAAISIQDASIPIIQNVDAQVRTKASDLEQGLVEQLYKPVLWTQSVQQLCAEGVVHIYECGPGKVLQGLIKRISKDTPCFALSDMDTLNKALAL